MDQPRILPTWGDIKENMHILLSQELSNSLVKILKKSTSGKLISNAESKL